MKGIVYLVGSGPGDPGLLTLRAKELLEKAQAVFYDHLVNPDILRFCPQAEKHYVGKIGHEGGISQDKIGEYLSAAAGKFSVIVRLKGGDPFIFGRGGEEAEFLARSGIPFEVVPGITSAIAVPAYAGIPLTHRNLTSSVTFVTGHEDSSEDRLDWSAIAKEKTIVLLMGVKNLAGNLNKLIEHGMPSETPAAIIEWGTYPRQRTVIGDLETLASRAAQENIQAPAITVIGEVVRLRSKLGWFEKRPLLGKRILVTRTREQASELSAGLRALGAEVVEFPTIQIEPPRDWGLLDRAIASISQYDWVLWTSGHAVDGFFKRLNRSQRDSRHLHGVRLGVVGPGTADQLRSRGLSPDREAGQFTGEALAKSLTDQEVRGKRILLARAEVADEKLVEELRRRGAELEVVAVYRNVRPAYSEQELKQVFSEGLDLLSFTSSSTVSNLVEILEGTAYFPAVQKVPSVVIGPVTRKTAEEKGFKVVGMPERHTIQDLIRIIVEL